ncbi:MAG: tRNA guanosine(34) transglycosylase Tgt [Ruminococcaceae bacterium]|nr:tRNA guanosine(34) transglycosylase Tgt [Oscillospiraceae bacterium]
MFTLIKTNGLARRGRFVTPHGTIETPVFMNVGTQAAIKGGLGARDLEELGCQIELSNTYHLHVRPGHELIRERGGLHRFMNWKRPILTDSGGFQVFSLASLRKITEEGVHFQSHVDGKRIFMGPEESMAVQSALGSDIAMAFDECVANPSPKPYVAASIERTTRWLERCKRANAEFNAQSNAPNPGQVLFGINQGGTFDDLRIEHMQQIAELDLPGYAIGGLAVGEPTEVMYHILDVVLPYAPANKPRYLMGVGTPANIIEGVARGIDFFDCVMPSRNARHGHLNTHAGIINLNNNKYATDDRPIEEGCQCPACRNYSRAYIRHLLKAGELLGGRLCVTHNLWFYNHLMEEIRAAIDEDRFDEYRREYSPIIAKRI